ncbi:serine/threonine-protein kinase ICK-like [Sceloporus undulatus]|uniref:serine/threonine-protein kinase ICK-like n=1 Tax=Sceloporus undulatus TaxID=8520 RepID=UPI001C4CE707|nr:serine/threonine-protein kinase ICK-like [Sceloporus undulatus]
MEGRSCKGNRGHTGSKGIMGAYISSFLKKEVGSADLRVQLAPIIDPSPLNPSSAYTSLKSVRPHIGRTSFNMPMKSTSGLLAHPPPLQAVHRELISLQNMVLTTEFSMKRHQ